METTEKRIADEILGRYGQGQRNFVRSDLRGIRWQGHNLSGADFNGSNFTQAQLQQANFSQGNLSNAQMAKAQLSEAQLVRTWIKRADLQGAMLQGADLREAQLKQACLAYAQMEGADFKKASLIATNLEHANLKGADFTQAVLSGADLRFAELRHVNFRRANLSGANLSGANLRWADLSGANLRWADLSGARLSGAKLMGADLSNAILSEASLVHADLSQAKLTRIDWAGADLSQTTLTGAKLYETPRFGLQTEGLLCEWVDLSPTGDRSHIHHLGPDEAQLFFRPSQPQVRVIIDSPLEAYSHLVIASFYHQIARKFALLESPPSIQLTPRRTTLTFNLNQESHLLAIAYLIVQPFKDAQATQSSIVELLKTLQELDGVLSPQEQAAIEQSAQRLGPLVGQLKPVTMPGGEADNFFDAPIQVLLQTPAVNP
ncbi:MAG: pentapeptide repeat-containing protein [Synechococcales cyanobacterium CRU_2_2]|nr:pentapeptide repeat-containing protein [Synechococcales cyanobacterium CRU_2_2]